MKVNSNTFKIALVFVVIVGVIFWTIDSVRSHSYSGANLNFDASGESITITNPSDNAIASQFIGSGSQTFRVSSEIEGVGGLSTRVGIGNARTQQFEVLLRPGPNEVTISGGTNVRFVADTETLLQATVSPMSSESRRNTLIVAALVVFGALFYASSLTEHQWVTRIRRRVQSSNQDTSKLDTKPSAVVRDGGQGRAARSYGDNRTDG